jgi:asparagine synthase (glutamine-hydrolysing)
MAAPLVEPLLAGLRHRGPDDEGVALIARASGAISTFRPRGGVASLRDELPPLADADACVHDLGLVHTRYAIIDLSDRAHQPFLARDGSLIAIYNGEIYNYRELRTELASQGVAFRTASDTEVLVEGYRVWGDDLWPRMNGFWAVVMYDVRRRALVVARDRMGVAPLYYRETSAGLFFASAIRPLLGVAADGAAIDRDAVRGFIDHGLKDFDDATCYQHVRSFPPACVLRFEDPAVGMADARRLEYWRYPVARWTTRDLSLDEAATRLRETLLRSVELRLRADVPVAFELSGGLDSSSIVASAATLVDTPLSTYTISVPGRDEEPFARLLRDRYALEYHVLQGDEARFDADGRRFDRLMEEPYHSPNSFTAWQMRRSMKSDGVAVVMSGSGGDECLAGYEYEFWSAASRELRTSGRAGHAVRHALAMRFGSGPRLRRSIAEAIGRVKRAARMSRGGRSSAAGDTETRAGHHAARYAALSFHERSIYQFTVAQLPYYLRNNDHLTMSIPLEHRFPFLDVAMVELGLQLPIEYLYRDGWSKYVLRRAMEPLLPPALVWRREKMGFPFPLQEFLSRRRDAFVPDCRRVADAGLIASPVAWDDMVRRDPMRAWRIVSTGRWLAAS